MCYAARLTAFTHNPRQLGLKHRQNRHQRQRIVVFVGSPVEADEKELLTVAKKLKKNNVAVDVVNFGEEVRGRAMPVLAWSA